MSLSPPRRTPQRHVREPGDIARLLEIMAQLRDPQDGCPWDRVQTNASIAGYAIEEAYEVTEAVSNGDSDELCDELGDLLLQVVFHAEMASEAGEFDFADVAAGLCAKLVRRHPHVFGERRVGGAATQPGDWERHKKLEREARARACGDSPSVLDGVPVALPALTRALKLQQRAAQVGFDWPDAGGALDKLAEEGDELSAALAAGAKAQVAEELGDVLFSWVNLARFHDIDPEAALRDANAKFARRFAAMETDLAARGRRPEGASLDELEALWQQAKAGEAG